MSEKSPEKSPQPASARIGGPYTAIVGLAFLVVIVVGAINLLGNRNSGIQGINFEVQGWPLPQFAVPDARGKLEGDANIAQDNCETSELPCPADRRRRPACRLRLTGIYRVCDFFDRPLVLSFWFTKGGDCERQQDVIDDVAGEYRGRVGFLSIDVRDERKVVKRLIDERRWRMPVGHDVDGAVSNLYRIGGCPTLVFAYPGGIGQSSVAGRLGPQRLRARVDRLVSESRELAREAR